MTPEELLASLQRRLEAAQRMPQTMAEAAKEATGRVRNPRVAIKVVQVRDTVQVRIASNDPRMGSRAVARRVKPVVVKAVDAAIRRSLRA